VQLDTKLSIPSQVMSRLVGDETVLLDLSSGIYFGLDGVGKRIWESLSEGLSLTETAAVIVREFDVAEEQAQADLIAFATDLVQRGLLTH
jgi:coenzyme PQQ synthesis protein D (PqqD)